MKGESPVGGLEVAGSLTSKRFPTGSRFAALGAIIGRVNHPPFEGLPLLALLAARIGHVLRARRETRDERREARRFSIVSPLFCSSVSRERFRAIDERLGKFSCRRKPLSWLKLTSTIYSVVFYIF